MTRRSPAAPWGAGLVLTRQVEINVNPDSASGRDATLDPALQVTHQVSPGGHVTTEGVRRATDGADPWWWLVAMRGMKWLADTRTPFDAFDLTLLGVPDPDHGARWGALFNAAASAGMIKRVGYTKSRRPTRAGGVCMVWVGCDAA